MMVQQLSLLAQCARNDGTTIVITSTMRNVQVMMVQQLSLLAQCASNDGTTIVITSTRCK